MKLSFKQEVEGWKTYFAEKINASFDKKSESIELICKKQQPLIHFEKICLIENIKDNKFSPKLHTIREDKKNKWQSGNKIHFTYNNRSLNEYYFAPTAKCLSVQFIKIYWDINNIPSVEIVNKREWLETSECLSDIEIETLAINDGFESAEDFFKWFPSEFVGKIIHWTDLSY